MNSTSKTKIRLILINSVFIGVFSIIGYIFIDEQPINFISFWGAYLFGFFPALFILSLEFFVFSKNLRRTPPIIKILTTSIIYSLILLFFILIIVIFFNMSPDYEAGKIGIFNILDHPDTKIGFFLLATAILILQFFNTLRLFLGKGLLLKLILGTYSQPREVEKIFMFLDVKNYTTYTEKVGHIKTLSLLKDFFADVSESVSQYQGEIYKYVGDEAIITWDIESGLKNHNIIKCFFTIKKVITKKEKYYLQKYGLIPEFKAGAHMGIVVSGEIGIEKKEIAFLGDSINTASRIVSSCALYNRDFLISKLLMENLEKNDSVSFDNIGKVNLKGKKDPIILFSPNINDF